MAQQLASPLPRAVRRLWAGNERVGRIKSKASSSAGCPASGVTEECVPGRNRHASCAFSTVWYFVPAAAVLEGLPSWRLVSSRPSAKEAPGRFQEGQYAGCNSNSWEDNPQAQQTAELDCCCFPNRTATSRISVLQPGIFEAGQAG